MNTEELLKKHEMEYEAILDIEGVHAVAIGRNKYGELCRRVFTHSEDINLLSNNHLLKDCEIIFEEPPIDDVLRIPKSEIKATEDYGRYRPMIAGIQLAVNKNDTVYFATLGAFVKSNDPQDDCVYILSNHHFFEKKDMSVYQPDVANEDRVAVVTEATKGTGSDSALAKVLNYDFNPKLIEEVGELMGTRMPTTDDIGKNVIKRGRTTGVTRGVITDVDCYIRFGNINVTREIRIESLDTNPYSMPGDSGSPVIYESDHKLLGIHYAGYSGSDHRIGFATSIDSVMLDLNIRLALDYE